MQRSTFQSTLSIYIGSIYLDPSDLFFLSEETGDDNTVYDIGDDDVIASQHKCHKKISMILYQTSNTDTCRLILNTKNPTEIQVAELII